MNLVSDEHLNLLVANLRAYRDSGVIDPWMLNDGTVIQPLDTLEELQALRASARCIGCGSPFEKHHHRHITRKGSYHTGCYGKVK